MWSSKEIGAKKPEKLQLLKLQSNNEIRVFVLIFLLLLNFFLFLMQIVCSVIFSVTLQERFIYLEMKLLPKRKLAVALLL